MNKFLPKVGVVSFRDGTSEIGPYGIPPSENYISEDEHSHEISKLVVPKDICGVHHDLGNKSIGCGEGFITHRQVYRCTDCGVPFHKHCAMKHFNKSTGTTLSEGKDG